MLEQDEITRILYDSGFSDEKILEYFNLTSAQQSCELDRARVEILKNLHGVQRKLECLDYLRYKIKENSC
ncbi:hypothetical protein [Companilactobacillus kimchiensis]|uniref:hypothetical protein n=1 Tax=Companilactobacillus kimchiensis TaxID=993692 RepID=UPI00070F1B3E|nr:hypothetical protein [Companilactobacillus kimchiensis]